MHRTAPFVQPTGPSWPSRIDEIVKRVLPAPPIYENQAAASVKGDEGAADASQAAKDGTDVSQAKPLSSNDHRETPVAIALDFFNDGQCAQHQTYSQPQVPGQTPPFPCSPKPNSVRIILYDTLNVFTAPRPSTPAMLPGIIGYPEFDSNFKLEPCADCIKSSKLNLFTLAMSRQRAILDMDNAFISNKPSSKTGVRPEEFLKSHQPSSEQFDGQNKNNITSQGFNTRKIKPSVDGKASSSSLDYDSSTRDLSRKTYRGAYSINILDIFALWDRKSPQASLNSGSNMMGENDELSDQERSWRRVFVEKVFVGILHTLHLREKMYIFYTVPCAVRYTWQSNNSLQVECRWFAAKFQGRDPVRNVLAHYFWDIIRSGSSAINLFDGNVDLAGRLIMFDLLSASVSCWIDFLSIVRRKSNRETRLVDSDKIAPMIDDRDHLIDFSRATRDLSRAIEVTIRAIKLMSKFSEDQQLKLDMLLLRQSAALEVLDDIQKDIDQNADQAISQYQNLTNKRQEATLKRLTLIASIFLPLSLACSMLSMTQRVNELGAIWWDWLGIVVIIALVVVSFYRVTTYWHDLWQRGNLRWASEVVSEQWKKAKQAVLDEDDRSGKPKQSSLMPRAPKYAYRACKYLFFLATAGSFLFGMFVGVSKGAQALGYSASGAVALFVLTVVLWRLAELLGYTFEGGSLIPEIAVKGKSNNKKERKRKLVLKSKVSTLMFGLLGIGLRVSKEIFAFFCGRKIQRVVGQMGREFHNLYADEVVRQTSRVDDSSAEKRGRRGFGNGEEEATDVATNGVEDSGERRESQVRNTIVDVENQTGVIGEPVDGSVFKDREERPALASMQGILVGVLVEELLRKRRAH